MAIVTHKHNSHMEEIKKHLKGLSNWGVSYPRRWCSGRENVAGVRRGIFRAENGSRRSRVKTRCSGSGRLAETERICRWTVVATASSDAGCSSVGRGRLELGSGNAATQLPVYRGRRAASPLDAEESHSCWWNRQPPTSLVIYNLLCILSCRL